MLVTRTTPAALLLAAGLLSSPAKADLVLESAAHLTGQGLGSTLTALTLKSPGDSTTESGGVLFNGKTFGDAGNGASQSSTFTLGNLGITSTNQLALIVNLDEPSTSRSATTALSSLTTNAALANTITLNVFSQAGTLLKSFSTTAGQTLTQVAHGIGGSGLVFGLTSDEGNSLDALLAKTTGTEVFTVGATFEDATGGPDAIQAAAISGVPEISTWAMMMAGFAGLGLLAYRRKGRKDDFRFS